MEDSDGYAILGDTIPQALKDATAEVALRQITETDGLIPDLENPASVKKTRVKVGPITDEIEYQGGNPPIKKFRTIDLLLKDLLHPSGRIYRA